MIFLTSTDHGCVYTLSQEDGDELYYAPIYTNGTVNLEEFAPVDMNEIDMDQMEVYDIIRRLKLINEVWRSENCPLPIDFWPDPFYITFVPEIPPMSVTLQANYKEVFAIETVEKIDELLEDNYDLDDILEFVDQNSEEDLVAYYEIYCTAGEKIGYDVVDAFVKYHGMSYVEYVEDAFRGVYYDEATFTEEVITEVYELDIPALVVVDWQATWDQNLRYDYDFIDGYVFSSSF